MGCCCSTLSRSALGAALLTLVVCVPGLFYASVLYSYRYDSLDSPACMAFAIATFAAGSAAGVLGVLETLVSRWDHHELTLKAATGVAALATALAVVYTIWAPIVLSSSFSVAESRAIALGTFILLAVFALVAPLAWSTWAYVSLLRSLRRRGAQPGGTTAAGGDAEGKLFPHERADIEMSLPRGRERRGRYARVGAEADQEGSAWERGSAGGGLSSAEEEEEEEAERAWEARRRERKARARRG
ncbi:hypothetical protein JCM10450v2_008197 [Rhodotorula kratochvilovae]